MTVEELERALFDAFPAEDAESWDHVGLSVGDPTKPVERVLVALDATAAQVEEARARGANVLVAHHPVYLKAPRAFTPHIDRELPAANAAVFRAARAGISIISMHTNLDRSLAARELLPQRMGQTACASLEHPNDPARTGLGAITRHEAMTLAALAQHAATAFATVPRVWGDPDRVITSTAYLGGSAGDLGELALEAGAHAIVCGEAGYHVCQDLEARGLSVILLGHDASELPFETVLAQAVERAGVDAARIVTSTQRRAWWVPQERE